MLTRKERLTKKEFQQAYKNSKTFYSNNFILKSSTNNKQMNSYGVMISKKVSKKSVIRNKLKRQILEIIRLNKQCINNGYSCIFVVKESAINLSYQAIEKEIIYLLKKAKIS
jgi:ribonuclease P protein component